MDRNEACGDAVDKFLTKNLTKARDVVLWLSQGNWPDGRALGKIKAQTARADFDRKVRPRAREWTWCQAGWRCAECGSRKSKANGKKHAQVCSVWQTYMIATGI